jgi:signal transduction histidine kinase
MPFPDTPSAEPDVTPAWDHLLAGDRLLAEGRENEAEVAYRRGVSADPGCSEAHRRLAVALFKRGDLADAADAARTAAELSPDSAEPWFTLGLILRDARDPRGALEAFDRVLALHPRHVDSLHYRGRVLYDAGDPALAVASFERATELRPDSEDIAHDLAIAHVACENWHAAEAWFGRCIELHPQNADTYYELGHTHEYDITTPDSEAEAAYRRALDLNPRHLPARFRLAVLWARRRHRDAQAREDAQRGLQELAADPDLAALFPDAHLVHYLLGTILDDGDEAAQAEQAYEACLSLRPSFAPAHNNLGVLARRKGRPELAAEHFTRSVLAEPGYDSALHNLSRVLYDQPSELAVKQIGAIVALLPGRAPELLARMLGHLVDAAKADAQGASYGKVHEVKNLLGVLGARMRQVVSSREREGFPEGDELLKMQGRAFDAIQGYLRSIDSTPLERERLHCGELLQKTLRQLAVTKPEGVEVHTQIPPALPPIMGDRRRLTQLFRDLTLNALEAMAEGGRLTVRAEPTRAEDVTGVYRGVRITLQDTGPGLSEEARQRAFDPGFTTKPTGSGYGLVVASQVVREHGGRLRLEAVPEGGTAAIIDLPERPPPEAVTGRLRLRPVIAVDWRRLIEAEVDAIQTDDGSTARRP